MSREIPDAATLFKRDMGSVKAELETTSELLNLAGNSTRLRLLHLIDALGEACVCDLADMLQISVSAVSQHLAKLRAYQLVTPRRDAQTIYYRLTDHSFNEKLRRDFFPTTETESGQRRGEIGNPLSELHNPRSGRLDARRIADYFDIPLTRLATAFDRPYSTVHKTPDAVALQPQLGELVRSIEILEEIFEKRPRALAWWNRPHGDLGDRAPLEVVLTGHGDAVHDMLEGSLAGIPS